MKFYKTEKLNLDSLPKLKQKFINDLNQFIDLNCGKNTNGYYMDFESNISDEEIADALRDSTYSYWELRNKIMEGHIYDFILEFLDQYDEYDQYDDAYLIADDYLNKKVTFISDIDSTSLDTYTLLDMGDANCGYNIPSCYFASEKLASDFANDNLFNKSGITWLIRSQGYDPIQFVKSLHSENGYTGDSTFLKSLSQELNGCLTNGLYAVCIPSIINASDCCNIINQHEHEVLYPTTYSSSYLEFDKGASVGLFDATNGHGSYFEIKLENNVKVPLPCAKLNLNYGTCSTNGYTLNAVSDCSLSNYHHGLREIFFNFNKPDSKIKKEQEQEKAHKTGMCR